MTLRVVGAGVGRTGTHSLKLALEQLLGAPCYHMLEVFGHPEHVPSWAAAADGSLTDWDAIFTGYGAAVDWPAAAFWREISAAYPDALVLLSVRDPDSWWKSASNTIWEVSQRDTDDEFMNGWLQMVRRMLDERFTPDWQDEAKAKAAFVRHNDEVRKSVPTSRLLEWKGGDGWAPICAALGVPVPDEPFPHVNTTAEFRVMTGLDPA